MPHRVVLTVLLAVSLTSATVALAETPAETLVGLLDSLDARIATGVHRDEITTYREQLAEVDRAALDDDDWVDLHCALLAVDRRLHRAPKARRPDIDTKDFDAFDHRLRNDAAFPIGAPRFEWTLRHRHGLPFDGAAITAIGLDARQMAREALAAHASEQDVTDWRELIEVQQANAPRDHATLVARAREDVDDVLAATERSSLVTVPEVALDLQVSAANRDFAYAFAAYFPNQRTRGGHYRGRYVIAPLPRGLRGAKRERWLSDFDPHFMRVVTAHEAYPGHHLQFAYADGVKRPARKHAYNSVYIEGWGFYSEALIEEMGALDGPLDRLAALRMRAWRAVRCYIDFALHTGRARPSQAAELLVRESGMSRRAAEREVKMYLNRPTQALSYEIGRRLIERMRAEYTAEHGEGALRAFHDRLLGLGVVPLPLAHAVIVGRRASYDRLHP